MRNHLLVLTASAFVLASGAASAQQGKGSGALTTPESTTQSGMTGHGDSTDMAAWHRSMGYGSPHGHMGHSPMMQMVFILADTNGDGKLSLQEFQAAHERMFKAMDSNKDGGLTLEEMQFFVHGSKD